MMDGKTITKTESDVSIQEIFYKDNLISKNDAKIQICFRENSTSGIIELNIKEFEAIKQKIKTEEALKKNKIEEVKQVV